MKTFLQYLKSRLSRMILLAACAGVSTLILYLGQVPMAAVGYAWAVCALFVMIFASIDYINFYKKHKKLSTIKYNLLTLDENLPDCSDLIEKDFEKIISSLSKENQRISDENESKLSDLLDYYTLWAHQVKTPIFAMRLILQEEDSEENAELLYQLQKTEQYVEMALNYVKIDSAANDFVIKECDIDSIIRQTVKKYSMQFIRSRVSLEYEPEHRTVLTDEKWLLFVIEQVLSNAVKYTKNGKVSIRVQDPCMLVIEDTGIGIAPEDLPRIFEKGFTGYNGREDKKASGLGLYLCRKICDNLGHGISAFSDGENGTVIKIDLSRDKLQVE